MQECCIFLNAFPPPDSLTPPGPNFGWRRGGFYIRPWDCAAVAGLHGRAMLAPTTRLKPPLCKGRWHGGSRDGGIVILRGQVDFLARSQSPTAYRRSPLYTRGPLVYPHRVSFGPGGVKPSGGVLGAPSNARALRADIESAPTVRTKGCDNRKVARSAAIPQRGPLRTTINKTTNRAISRYRKTLRADIESAPTPT